MNEGGKARKKCRLVCWGRVREKLSCYKRVEHSGQDLADGNTRMRQGMWVECRGQVQEDKIGKWEVIIIHKAGNVRKRRDVRDVVWFCCDRMYEKFSPQSF